MVRNVQEMMNALKSERIHTWFDLGLFIDRLKENRKIPAIEIPDSFEEYCEHIADGGISFITFEFGIDGVSLEVEKYAATLRKILKNVTIHYIAGKFHSPSEGIIHPTTIKHEIKEIQGFDHWPLYYDFFKTKLERGSEEYNALIGKFWKEVLVITEKIGNCLTENDIRLLYLINTNSNPGNVSLSLAIVFISEYLGIPVINNNHDFYWEDGSRKIDIALKRKKPGHRDHFFTNSDIGEFFSQIEVLFPWESRSWMNVNINFSQCRQLIEKNGLNPANIDEVVTAIDMEKFDIISKDDKDGTLRQIGKLLSRFEEQLVIYDSDDVVNPDRISEISTRPFMIGSPRITTTDFLTDHVILLQPTRIIARKRIEFNFQLVKRLFENESFLNNINDNPRTHLTILVTGPIAAGQYNYFLTLLKSFQELRKTLKPDYKDRVFMGFLFSAFDKSDFKEHFGRNLNMPDIYNIASLILLPSETEGRGLPIIESAASGVPIFCRRYHPEEVYAEIIGERLEEKYRLKVLEFKGDYISDKLVEEAVKRMSFPRNFRNDIEHNKNVVRLRFNSQTIEKNLHNILYKSYLQLQPNTSSLKNVEENLDKYKKICSYQSENLKELLRTDNRCYLPGYGKLEFMLFLKSLIDPSFFRVEEQQVRGMIMGFAWKLINENFDPVSVNCETLHSFYNAVDNIFLIRQGKIETRHDHSLAYRHRNKIYYPYRDFTHQELTGLVNMLFHKMIVPKAKLQPNDNQYSPLHQNSEFHEIITASNLAIDDRDLLFKKLGKNTPIAYFPGEYDKEVFEFLVLQPLRKRFKLEDHEKISKDTIDECQNKIAPVCIFCPEKTCGKHATADSVLNRIKDGNCQELDLLLKHRLCRIIKTHQLCVGIHFSQLGEDALDVLLHIKQQKGFIITDDRDAPVMTDIVDIDRFHIGKANHELTAEIMGIPLNSGYIQYVPSGIRTTIAYPTPVQTAKDFHNAIGSPVFKKLRGKYGEEGLLKRVKEDAETVGTPITTLIEQLEGEGSAETEKSTVSHSFICGLYRDGRPWNGTIAKVNIKDSEKKWKFSTLTGEGKIKRVTTFIEDFRKTKGKNPAIAWNGGFILNAELVGKLGLPETYIGSPLGLIVIDSEVVCPPLFNKPALLIYPDSSMDIKRVSCSDGVIISDKIHRFELAPDNLNPKKPLPGEVCFYDLKHRAEIILGDGRIVVRLAGTSIKEVIRTKKNQSVTIIPAGLTLSFPKSEFPEDWNRPGKSLRIEMKDWDQIEHAIEAGPMLVENGSNCIDMEIEGWKMQNSIRTQAARLDYTDMRGPKIAIGLDENGNLSILAINGRIRESVGATHIDMAEIMIDMGIKKAMEFDPGGSSTLVVLDKVLNISPYNSNYENNVYSLPPEPRAVANAVIGWQD